MPIWAIENCSLVLSPALAGVLGSDHGLDVRNGPLPECLSSHVTGACTHLGEHLVASLCAGLWRSQAKVTRDCGSTGQQLVKLVLCDTARARFVSLNEAVEDEVVERGSFVGPC